MTAAYAITYNQPVDYNNIEKVEYYKSTFNKEEDLIQVPSKPIFILGSLNKLIDVEFEKINLTSIKEAIERSRFILDLNFGWDGEDALTISENLYFRVIDYLNILGKFIYENYNESINGPSINPCKDGTIDLEWNIGFNHLLINIKDDLNGLDVHYYGFNSETNNSIKGIQKSFAIDEDLAFWMKKLVY